VGVYNEYTGVHGMRKTGLAQAVVAQWISRAGYGEDGQELRSRMDVGWEELEREASRAFILIDDARAKQCERELSIVGVL
jgi:hypothetical protein